ncbi:MAG: helix-turn-helix domain-containing protein [Sphingopyxis sp.]
MTKTQWRSHCPINIGLEILGDRWSLLIVRDLMMKGRDNFRALLDGGEHIASNMLSDRLAKFEEFGIIVRHEDQNDLRRKVYTLTERGIALAPLLYELIVWTAEYEKTAAPPEELKKMKHNRDSYLREIEASAKAAAKSQSSKI